MIVKQSANEIFHGSDPLVCSRNLFLFTVYEYSYTVKNQITRAHQN